MKIWNMKRTISQWSWSHLKTYGLESKTETNIKIQKQTTRLGSSTEAGKKKHKKTKTPSFSVMGTKFCGLPPSCRRVVRPFNA